MRRIICAFFIQWIFINFCLGQKEYQDLSLPDEIYTHEEVDTALDTQIKVPSGPLNINEVWLHEKGLEIYNAISARKNRSRRGTPDGKAEQDVDGKKNGTTTVVPGGVVKQDIDGQTNGTTGVTNEEVEQDVDGQKNVPTKGGPNGIVEQNVDGKNNVTITFVTNGDVEQDVEGNKNGTSRGVSGGKVEQDVDSQKNETTTGVTNGEVEQGVNGHKNATSRCVPGGEVEQDVHDPKYKELALESFNTYSQSHELPNFRVKEIIVTRVTTQVVSGIIYRINFSVLSTEGSTLSFYSEILEQAWLPKREFLEVICKYNPKNGTTRVTYGGEVEQDVHDPKYKKLAQESFDKWRVSHELPPHFHAKEVNVTRVTTQVVAGVVYRINFNELSTDDSMLSCFTEIWEQAWLHKKEFLEVVCEYNPKNGTTKVIYGGEVEQDVHDPKYKELAQESFDKWHESHELPPRFHIKEINVTRVTTQIVSGVIYRINFNELSTDDSMLTCFTEIWEQAWLHKREFLEVICEYNPKNGTTRVIYGGEVEQDVHDPKYKELAQESFDKWRESHELPPRFHIKEINVTRVTTQIVSGVIYRINFSVLSTDGSTISCYSEIWEQAWLPKREFLEVICERNPKNGTTRRVPSSEVKQDVDGKKNETASGVLSGKVEKDIDGKKNGTTRVVPGGDMEQDVGGQKSETTPGVPGGEVEQDVHDPKYKELALESFNKYRQSHELPHFHTKEINVTRVTSQVVAGVIYRINFDVLPTEGGTLTCHSKVMEPLQQNKTIEVNCGVLGTGGEKEQNVHDPKYKHLALEFFNKWRESYLLHDYHIKEINITRVTTQVVAGLITRIHFNVLPTEGATFLCYYKDLVPAWPQNMEFELNCEIDKKYRNIESNADVPHAD